MQRNKTTCISWANWSNLDLPLYRLCNQPLLMPESSWSKLWVYPFPMHHYLLPRYEDFHGLYRFQADWLFAQRLHLS
jgi:hypothetical protein